MAKKKQKESPVNLLDMMYQKGYKDGYIDGVAKGKKLILDALQDTMDKADSKKGASSIKNDVN